MALAQVSLWQGQSATESAVGKVFPDQVASKYVLSLEEIVGSEYSWYWSATWQGWEREADDDWESGRYEAFESMDDFIDSLDTN